MGSVSAASRLALRPPSDSSLNRGLCHFQIRLLTRPAFTTACGGDYWPILGERTAADAHVAWFGLEQSQSTVDRLGPVVAWRVAWPQQYAPCLNLRFHSCPPSRRNPETAGLFRLMWALVRVSGSRRLGTAPISLFFEGNGQLDGCHTDRCAHAGLQTIEDSGQELCPTCRVRPASSRSA